MSDISSIISGAAQAHGQDPTVLLRIGQIESGLDPSAVNADSGARGLFQFMPKTAAAYGVNTADAESSADGAARLLRDNRATLTKRLGRDPTGPELYLAHQQGAGGAAKLLANPDAPAASIVGSKAVLQNGGSQGMTSRDYTGMWMSRYGNAKPSAGSSSIGTLFAGGLPPPANTPAAPPTALNPAAMMAAQLPLDAGGDPMQPRRAPAAGSGLSEAKRRALITGQGGLGALFA